MAEREFNLLDEPWIQVMHRDGSLGKVSLTDAFEQAGALKGLAGELPTQDTAVLRLLLAVLHTVVARYDAAGEEAPIESPTDALGRWKAIWNAGRFPMETIRAYLADYHDRFWLFDPERPFYQVPELGKGTEYTAAKLNGELSESNNKVRLFQQRSGSGKRTLAYDEAARWLLHLNAFDDTSGKKMDSRITATPGAGWLGKLGIVLAEGDNLFETLMLNLVLLRDGQNELWGEEHPVWESECVRRGERIPVSMPDNLSEIYTTQSRRIELRRAGEYVIGYVLIGGDFFEKDNAFNEQMTLWRNTAKSKTSVPLYQPHRHDPARQIWRDFAALMAKEEGRRPGVVNWLACLTQRGALDRRFVRLRTVCAKYADKDFYIKDVFSDSMTFSAAMLNEKGERWVGVVMQQIETSKALVDQLACLAQCIAKATGYDTRTAARDSARETAYYRLDFPFREWLEGIDAENDEQDAAEKRWWDAAQRIVRDAGRELIASAGPQALTGRTYKSESKGKQGKKGKKSKSDNGKDEDKFYCAPDAYNRFLYYTSSPQALAAGGKQNGR